jgi:ElaB/YqjD/DUF883 family membrane-anchored ribosome-binding protein
MNESEAHTGGMPGPGAPEPKSDRTPDEIEREIEETRDRMGRDIDELGQRLSPQNLKQQAKEAITEKGQEIADKVGAQARYTGSRVVNFIQENPSLVAAMGLGAVWLVQQRNRSGISGDRMARYAYTGPERRAPSLRRRIGDRASEVRDPLGGSGSAAERIAGVKDQAEEVVDRAREQIGEFGQEARARTRELGETAKEQVQRVRGTLERAMDENPLALVAGAAVLGLAVGLLVPESRGERRLMGPARDRLMERVEHTAARVKDAAIEAGQEVQETVREEIASRGPELKASLTDAAESVGQQVKESAERVKEEAKQAVREQPGGRGPERA